VVDKVRVNIEYLELSDKWKCHFQSREECRFQLFSIYLHVLGHCS